MPELPREAVRLARERMIVLVQMVPDKPLYMALHEDTVAIALSEAAPAIRAQERERVKKFIEKVEFEVGCMRHYAEGRRDTLGKLAREIAEPLEAALAELKQEQADA